MTLSLLGLCGSLRAESYNRALMQEAARLFGAELKEANLRLPLYDGDLEKASGIPADVQTLADQITAADAALIASPEYNQSLSGVLKNALDWVSRVDGKPWLNKPCCRRLRVAPVARAPTTRCACAWPPSGLT